MLAALFPGLTHLFSELFLDIICKVQDLVTGYRRVNRVSPLVGKVAFTLMGVGVREVGVRKGT